MRVDQLRDTLGISRMVHSDSDRVWYRNLAFAVTVIGVVGQYISKQGERLFKEARHLSQ